MKLMTDPYTGESFRPSRRNQIFAKAVNRINYYNEKAAALRDVKSPVDKQLTLNFLILTELVKLGEKKMFHKEQLIKKGYDKYYFTHLDEYEGKKCMCIYHFFIPFSEKEDFITVIYPTND